MYGTFRFLPVAPSVYAALTASIAILDRMSAVENPPETTRPGGITGAGFKPGQSGNPGGRPKGLARTVRDACGGSPERLAQVLLEIAENPKLVIVIEWLRFGSCLIEGGARLLPSQPLNSAIRLNLARSRARFNR
jgi:hypothetical protein